MNYLELCRFVARESGTVSGKSIPATVSGQQGRLHDITVWVRDSWWEIQQEHYDWDFMRKSFSGNTIAGTQEYMATAWNINDLSNWWRDLTCYTTATGVSDEQNLSYMEYSVFRETYLKRTQNHNRPQNFTFSPSGGLMLGPIPDAEYTIRGEYQTVPLDLVEDTDIPSCPERYHRLIAWGALETLAGYDEDAVLAAPAQSRRQRIESMMERDQLPQIRIELESIV